MKDLKYIDLPEFVRSNYGEDQILVSYSVSDSETLIIWVINSGANKQVELEYSYSQNRFLSFEERNDRLPNAISRNIKGLSVIKSYGLERDSGSLYEHYRAYRDGRSEVLAMCSQIYYSSYRESEKAMVRKVFDEIDRQNLYSGFTDQEKINFWAARLYRQRRQIGEEGGDENDIFDEDF